MRIIHLMKIQGVLILCTNDKVLLNQKVTIDEGNIAYCLSDGTKMVYQQTSIEDFRSEKWRDRIPRKLKQDLKYKKGIQVTKRF